jgi:hypothetical protein
VHVEQPVADLVDELEADWHEARRRTAAQLTQAEST